MDALGGDTAYTTDDIYALPDGERAELIDGRIYYMAPPGTGHQRLLNYLVTEVNLFIRNNNGECEVFPAPFAVFLNEDDKTYVEPDISVICDKIKLRIKVVRGRRTGSLKSFPPAVNRWIIIRNYLSTIQQESGNIGLLIRTKKL